MPLRTVVSGADLRTSFTDESDIDDFSPVLHEWASGGPVVYDQALAWYQFLNQECCRRTHNRQEVCDAGKENT